MSLNALNGVVASVFRCEQTHRHDNPLADVSRSGQSSSHRPRLKRSSVSINIIFRPHGIIILLPTISTGASDCGGTR
jgi:hypothetical protein